MTHTLVLGENVLPPLYISSRLMTALHVENAGTLHLLYKGRNDEGRCRYLYAVTDINDQVIDEDLLFSGVGADVDYLRTMEALLSFLGHYAEEYRSTMTGEGTFEEWCYLHDTELASAQLNLQEVTDA